MTRPEVDVVIPVYGQLSLTLACLRALAKQTLQARVVVVDNASVDGSAERLRELGVELIEMSRNQGFGAAANAGIEHSQAEFVVLLNNDVEAPPDFVEQLVAPLTNDPSLGMVAPLLLRPGAERIDSVGLAADKTLAGFPRHQGLPVAAAGGLSPALLGTTGAAGAYRRSALEAVGNFDETIFMYGEDLELALRIRAAGWSATVALNARAIHLGGASAGRRSGWQRKQSGFSRGYMLRRFRNGPGGVARAAATEAIVMIGDAILSGDSAATLGRLEGWRAAGGGRLPTPVEGVDRSLGFLESLRLRRADYAEASRGP